MNSLFKKWINTSSSGVGITSKHYNIVEQPFIDPIVKEQLDKVKERVFKRNQDFVAIIDGREGSGKSCLVQSLAKYCDSSFGLNNMHWDFVSFIEDLTDDVGHSAVMDEGYHAVGSRNTMSSINKLMVAIGTEMRQNNNFVFIVLPSFFDLDKYYALWRCNALFHVYYDRDQKRGRYLLFPYKAKNKLYLKGKKDYNYNSVKSPYPPLKFYDQWCFDVDKYKYKKSIAFKKRGASARKDKKLEIIEKLLDETNRLTGKSKTKILHNLGIDHTNVSKYRQFAREMGFGEIVRE